MNVKKLTCAALVSAAFALGAAPAQAVPILTLSDGTNTASVSDGGLGDANPLAGAVTFIGSVGIWYLNVTTGSSNAPAPGGQPAELDLSSVDANSSGSGTLTITLTDLGLTTPVSSSAQVNVDVGGTLAVGTGNSASFSVEIVDATSSPLATIGLGPYTTTSYSASTASGSFDNSNSPSFGIVETAVIHHETAGKTSFDLITYVPEPATLGLLGLALVGLGFGRRRKAA